MKFRLKKKRGVGVASLVVEGGKGDEIDYVDAERLQRGDLESFIPFSYEKKGKCYRFVYEAQGLVCLEDVLSAPLAPMQLRVLLRSFLGLLRDCEEHELMRQRVAMEPGQLLYDAAGRRMRFAYVPLQSFVSSSADMSGALAYVCEKALVPPADEVVRDAALDYARRRAVVTGVELESFLKGLGICDGRDDEAHGSSDGREGTRISTEQLGERARHGFDFVGSRSQEAPGLHGGSGGAASSFALVRLSSGASWRLSEDEQTVGRCGDCAISLGDVCGLSRRHALFRQADECLTVRDLNSTNGVLVNGRRIEPMADVPVRRGDRLTLGDEEFEVR